MKPEQINDSTDIAQLFEKLRRGRVHGGQATLGEGGVRASERPEDREGARLVSGAERAELGDLGIERGRSTQGRTPPRAVVAARGGGAECGRRHGEPVGDAWRVM